MPPKVEFTGDPKQLVAALDKLEEKYKKLEHAIGGVAKQSKQGHNEIKAHFSEQITGLAAVAASYFTVEKAIELTVEVNRHWLEEQEKIAHRVDDTNAALVKQLSLAGNLLEVEKVRAALSNLQLATPEQAIQAFSGVQAGAPQATIDQKIEIAKAVAPLAATGRDVGPIGAAAGQIFTLGGMTPKQAGGMANIFEQQTGGGFDRALSEKKFQPVRQLEQAGFDRNQLLAMEVVAVRNQMGSVLKDLSGTVLSDEAAPRGASARGPEGKAKRLLAKMTPEERMAAIVSGDESIQAGLPDKLRMAGDLFSEKKVGPVRAMFAGSATSIDGEIAKLQATKTGREVSQEALAGTRKIDAEGKGEDVAKFMADANQELAISMRKHGAGSAFEFMSGSAFSIARMMHGSDKEGIIGALRAVDEGAAAALVQREEIETGHPLFPGSETTRGLHTPEIAATLGESSEVLKDILIELRQQRVEDGTNKRTTATPTNPNQR